MEGAPSYACAGAAARHGWVAPSSDTLFLHSLISARPFWQARPCPVFCTGHPKQGSLLGGKATAPECHQHEAHPFHCHYFSSTYTAFVVILPSAHQLASTRNCTTALPPTCCSKAFTPCCCAYVSCICISMPSGCACSCISTCNFDSTWQTSTVAGLLQGWQLLCARQRQQLCYPCVMHGPLRTCE